MEWIPKILVGYVVAFIVGFAIAWIVKPGPVIVDAHLPAHVTPLKPIIVTVEDSAQVLKLKNEKLELESRLHSVYGQMGESSATRIRLQHIIDSLVQAGGTSNIVEVNRHDSMKVRANVELKDTTVAAEFFCSVWSHWYGQPINALGAPDLIVYPFTIPAQYRYVTTTVSSMPWLWLSGGGAYSHASGGPSAFLGISGFQAGALWMPDREPTYIATVKVWGFPH